MGRCIRLFLQQGFRFYFTFFPVLFALAALEAGAQSTSNPPSKNSANADVFQKASLKRDAKTAEKTTCTVSLQGAVTALVKNGVELSTSDDWDCDGVPDAYDNCVGIANASQADANSNGIGDGCESALTIRSGPIMSKKTELRRRNSEDDRKKKAELKSPKSAETRKPTSKSKTSKSSRNSDRQKSSRNDAKPQRKKR